MGLLYGISTEKAPLYGPQTAQDARAGRRTCPGAPEGSAALWRLLAGAGSKDATETLVDRAKPWQDAPVNRAPKLNRERLRLLTGAAGLVLGESHPTTQALARAITTWDWQDISWARAQMRQLDAHLRALLDDLARRAGSRA